jgi:hypothetical protein
MCLRFGFAGRVPLDNLSVSSWIGLQAPEASMLIARSQLQAVIDEIAEAGFARAVSGETLQAIVEAAEGGFAFEDAYVAISAPLSAEEAAHAAELLQGRVGEDLQAAIADLWSQVVEWRVDAMLSRDRPT